MALDYPFAFISYARTDAADVLRIAEQLRHRGVMIWVDQFELKAGERWDRSIQLALESCVSVVVFLTSAAVDSENVLDEISYGLDEGKIIVPVLLRECKVPLRLSRQQRIALTSNEEAGINELVRVLPHGQHPATETVKRTTTDASAKQPLVAVPPWGDAGAMLKYAEEIAERLGDPSIYHRAHEHYKTYGSAVADYRDGSNMSSRDDILEALTSLKEEVRSAWEQLSAQADEQH